LHNYFKFANKNTYIFDYDIEKITKHPNHFRNKFVSIKKCIFVSIKQSTSKVDFNNAIS